MLRKLFISVGIILCTSVLVFSQNGTLKGKIIDKATKEPIPFANVIVEQGGKQFGGTTSDIDGNYTIRPLPAGKFDVKATYVGYKPLLTKGVVITSNTITFSDITMEATVTTIETFEVVDYKVPLISKDQTQSGETVTSDDIAKMPGRSAQAVAATVGGVFSQDGSMGSVRGQRTDGTVTYIDGVRVRGSSGLPKSAIEEVGVILGGTPAKYGEATGGILNIVTKGPSREFGGSLEFATSELTDKFGYNVASFSLNGPLLKSRDPKQTTSLLGFFISGEFQYIRDTRPFSGGDYKVNDEKREFLEKNPLLFKTQGNDFAIFYNADYLRKTDLEKYYTKQNGESKSFNVAGKIDVRTTKNTNLTFGGSFDYNDGRLWSRSNEFLNSVNNGQEISSTMRVYGKFTQRFPTDKDSKSLIKNIFYQIQADYTKVHAVDQDRNHKDNLFRYGYVGKFTTYKAPYYQVGSDTVNGIAYNDVMVLAAYYDTLVTFERSELNPTLSNYTSQLFGMYPGTIPNFSTISFYKGLLNGDRPASVYGLISNTGTNYNSYSVYDQEQIGFNANGSADIGNHAVEFGLQFEQLIERSYGYSPAGLWTLARDLTNRHIRELDMDNPILVPGGAGTTDLILYNRKYSASEQAYFDINVRKALGLPVNGTDWINIDKYNPDMFNVNMFSPDELFNNGNSYVSYYGYDHTGNKVSGKPSFQDFFNNRDANGNYKRTIGAFQPVYMAGYIQDKFAFNDLIFNVGLRIDRFDANQMVLKDPYLFYESKTVADVTNKVHPSNIGSDYTVYVDDYKKSDPTILGYRSGEKWYTASGTYIEDPYLIKGSSGKPTPWRVNKDQKELNINAFKDYEPQTTFMPRISFSFPISDEALFFAHYDIITKRPTTGLRMDPIAYLFITEQGTNIINNPDLKPEKTTDYELGFQQKLSNASSLKFSAYYREIRNLVQAHKFTGADPNPNYVSYTNVDFGTVKGMTMSYDLRRTSNVRIRASYTMQFADGTGSSATSQLNLVSAGQPNLRTMSPLAYDQRHAVKVDLDFRYDMGKKYNGPTITKKIKGTDKVRTIPLLENTGFHLSFNGGSGTPYTKTDIVSGNIQGSQYGSRLPWQFWLDATIDRDIFLKFGKGDEKNKKYAYLNVYVEVLNLLDTRNIIGVYSATGNPDDDGYLSSAQNQKVIEVQTDPQSFRDLRSALVASPYNYSLPRRIRVGVVLNF